MNIDKIYKPLKKDLPGGFYLPIYDPTEVQDLEEKYKELLADKILNTRLKEAEVLHSTKRSPVKAKQVKESISLLEKHTGLSWEELQEPSE